MKANAHKKGKLKSQVHMQSKTISNRAVYKFSALFIARLMHISTTLKYELYIQ